MISSLHSALAKHKKTKVYTEAYILNELKKKIQDYCQTKYPDSYPDLEVLISRKGEVFKIKLRHPEPTFLSELKLNKSEIIESLGKDEQFEISFVGK